MKIRQILSIGCFLWILATLRLVAQQPEIQPLPIDPKVKYGQLSNGLTYYIRHNAQPKDRADFFIAQNVGSILEDENQRGLAHFLEHMAFDGTRNFPARRYGHRKGTGRDPGGMAHATGCPGAYLGTAVAKNVPGQQICTQDADRHDRRDR